MLPIEQPFKTYTNLDGKALDNGYVYFGQPNQDPIAHPVTVYWDAAGTLPAAQPLRTVNGYIMNLGTPSNVFVDGPYSELVWDSKKRQVFYAQNSDDFSIFGAVKNLIALLASSTGASMVGFIQAGVGAIKRTAEAKLRERVSVVDFGAIGDGTTDDTVAVQKALDYAASVGLPLITPVGQLLVSGLILPSNTDWHLGSTVLTRKNAANVPLLRNANTTFTPGAYSNSNIVLRGGVLDFNGMNQADAGADGAWLVGVRFVGVRGLEFHGTQFKNSRRFNIFLCNCTKIRAYNTEIINDPAIPSHNKDGYHINGNVTDFYADVITARFSDDDAIALNADDMAFGGDLTIANICGQIQDIRIDMLRCLNTRNGVRMLSASNRIRNVEIGSITGDVSVYALNLQDYGLGSASWYQNIRIGTIDCLFSKRAYPEATLAMVNVETPNHSTDAYSDIYIGSVHRAQNNEDGQDRPTVNFTAYRTKLQIGEISESNCINRFAVQMTGAKAGAKFELGRHQRWNSRPDSGIYGSTLKVASAASGVAIDFIKVDEVQADKLQHVMLVQDSTIVQVDVEKLTPTDNAPIYLVNSNIQRLFWKAIDTQSYGVSSNRYFKDATSTVSFERPAPLGGTTAQRPTNAAYGDCFLDISIGKPIWWSGAWAGFDGHCSLTTRKS